MDKYPLWAVLYNISLSRMGMPEAETGFHQNPSVLSGYTGNGM